MLERIHEQNVRMKELEVTYKYKIYNLEDELKQVKEKVFYLKLILILTFFIFITSMFIMNDNKEAIARCIEDGNTKTYCENLIERD